MLRKMRLYSIFLFSFLIACSGNDTAIQQRDTLQPHLTDSIISMKDTVAGTRMDSAKYADSVFIQSIKNWSTADFIISEKYKSFASLRNLIEHTREEWKNVQSPFKAVYTGCDIGDYFHLNFEDAQGKSYDFGFGNNNYGDILLFDTVAYESNRKYVGRSFRIHWTWKISKFPCCDGEYDNVEAYYPSITKLELIQE